MIELTLVYLDSCDVMQIVLFVNVTNNCAVIRSSTFIQHIFYATDNYIDVFIYDLLQTLRR